MDIRAVHVRTQISYPNFLVINWVSDFFHLTFYTFHQPVPFCLPFCDYSISSLAQGLSFDPVQIVAQYLQYMLIFLCKHSFYQSQQESSPVVPIYMIGLHECLWEQNFFSSRSDHWWQSNKPVLTEFIISINLFFLGNESLNCWLQQD